MAGEFCHTSSDFASAARLLWKSTVFFRVNVLDGEVSFCACLDEIMPPATVAGRVVGTEGNVRARSMDRR